MPSPLIDVWDAATFDAELNARLEASSELLRNYLARDHAIFLSHDLGRGPGRSTLRPDNEFAAEFLELQEVIGRSMEARTIRAYHYTRLTDEEIALLTRDGLHLSTPASLRERLDALVASGHLPHDVANLLYAASPFHSDQLESRSGKFWMTSHPQAIDDGGVISLLDRWGGEVASMWVDNEELATRLRSLGTPHVLEIAVPMSSTRHSYHAGRAVVASFARAHGSIPEKLAFDLYVDRPLPAEAILAAHSEGSVPFATMGRGYPARFVDVAIGRWKELTGEDD
ncbi:hypothetical protein [Hyphomicrobium sp.]|uniref:hypothetical protein n=1 Tax=Hyphomicrobium sp. TaxID=82 RepID=UPI002FE3E54A